jgi:hypothetical protein
LTGYFAIAESGFIKAFSCYGEPISGEPLAADPLQGRQRMEMIMELSEMLAPVGEILKLLAKKKVTTERLTLLLSTGILADVLDPEADLTVFRRKDIRAALRMEPLQEPSFAERFLDIVVYGHNYDEEAHSSVLCLIERILRTSLRELAFDDIVLSEALGTLDLLPMKNRLRRAGIVTESTALDRDEEGMLTQLIRYIRCYHVLCLIQNIDPPPGWDIHIYKLIPDSVVDDDGEKQKQWILETLFHSDFFGALEAKMLLDHFGLPYTE